MTDEIEDIVGRLRRCVVLARDDSGCSRQPDPICAEAADEIERLRSVLQPFADALSGPYDDLAKNCPVWETGAGMEITFGDLRRAKAALDGKP